MTDREAHDCIMAGIEKYAKQAADTYAYGLTQRRQNAINSQLLRKLADELELEEMASDPSRTITGPDGETFCRWCPQISSDWWNNPEKVTDELTQHWHNRNKS
jgi:hypothetical protein